MSNQEEYYIDEEQVKCIRTYIDGSGTITMKVQGNISIYCKMGNSFPEPYDYDIRSELNRLPITVSESTNITCCMRNKEKDKIAIVSEMRFVQMIVMQSSIFYWTFLPNIIVIVLLCVGVGKLWRVMGKGATKMKQKKKALFKESFEIEEQKE